MDNENLATEKLGTGIFPSGCLEKGAASWVNPPVILILRPADPKLWGPPWRRNSLPLLSCGTSMELGHLQASQICLCSPALAWGGGGALCAEELGSIAKRSAILGTV